jgi:hypothetical protein
MSYFRHCRESGNPDCVEFPGFRLALAIASLAGMTPELCSALLGHDTRLAVTDKRVEEAGLRDCVDGEFNSARWPE